MEKDFDKVAVDTIRALSMDAVQAANSGHPGTPMALAPLGWTLFTRIRKHDPAHPWWPDRDRFVLSCGHASMLQYSLLHLTGYDLPLDELKKFRQWESRTPGHPEAFHTAGVETTTGPLGQGFANAVGMAMAERHLAERFNRPGHTIIDHHTWVFASDGDLMEGLSGEAASLAGHLGLGKLVVFWDDNRITIDGSTDLSFSEDVLKRFDAYGWHTSSIDDCNDIAGIERITKEATSDKRPSFIRVRTVIGFPAPTKQNTAAAHGAPLGEGEIKKTREIMGWPDVAFHVPAGVQEKASTAAKKRGAEWHGDWEKRLAAYSSAFPSEAAALRDALDGRLPSDWSATLPTFKADLKGMATRKSSGNVLAAISERVPNLVGGSADLTGSNLSYQPGRRDFHAKGEGAPHNVYWGVREHAMASACNGMALHGGVRPYGATFLVFSDYMRPALRLAALMKLPVRMIFTHDSIGLGEDGPTHQPVEHLAALRAIPGMTVLRPADANEVREAWKVAITRRGPVALVLTRQDVPTLDRNEVAGAEGVQRGAYVLAEATGGSPQALIIATGSEVSLALAARTEAQKKGVRVRVVSMPSWELFAEQDAAYRDSVLPASVSRRVVVEAASSFGWERWAGADARFVTLDHFGASAPYETLYKQFGITVERVVSACRA